MGCGQTRPRGWTNVDSSLNSLAQGLPLLGGLFRSKSSTTYQDPALYMDLNKRWKFKDASVDLIYASHMFEHLSISGATHFLRESKRVLKSNGVLRLVVPDLESLAEQYLTSLRGRSPKAANEFLYWLNLHKENAYPNNRTFFARLANLWQDYPHQHKCMYDAQSLEKLLSEHDFNFSGAHSYAKSGLIPEICEVEFTSEGVASIYLEAQLRRA